MSRAVGHPPWLPPFWTKQTHRWGTDSAAPHPGSAGPGRRGDSETREHGGGRESAAQRPHPQSGGPAGSLRSTAEAGPDPEGQRPRARRAGVRAQSARLFPAKWPALVPRQEWGAPSGQPGERSRVSCAPERPLSAPCWPRLRAWLFPGLPLLSAAKAPSQEGGERRERRGETCRTGLVPAADTGLEAAAAPLFPACGMGRGAAATLGGGEAAGRETGSVPRSLSRACPESYRATPLRCESAAGRTAGRHHLQHAGRRGRGRGWGAASELGGQQHTDMAKGAGLSRGPATRELLGDGDASESLHCFAERDCAAKRQGAGAPRLAGSMLCALGEPFGGTSVAKGR